jgi:hypothetical protein
VSGYLMMRESDPTPNGALHPVWSAMFRICDGLRLVTHEMLFTPTDGVPHAPTRTLRAAEIYPYVERKQLLLSEHGVCSGPKALIEEFAAVFVDGTGSETAANYSCDATLSADLTCLDSALDYGLRSLQTYAVVFSLWPLVSQTHEQLLRALSNSSGSLSDRESALQQRLQHDWPNLVAGFLGDAAARDARMRAHADMYSGCARGLSDASGDLTLRLGSATSDHKDLTGKLSRLLGAANVAHAEFAEILAVHLCQEQALVRVAGELQAQVNQVLGRRQPSLPLTASDLALHHRLRIALTLPYLDDTLSEVFGWTIRIDSRAITVCDATAIA